MLRRDFKGDTPIHTAAKHGSIRILEFFLTAVTPVFLEMQNDFGLTPIRALELKLELLQERIETATGEKKDKLCKKYERC